MSDTPAVQETTDVCLKFSILIAALLNSRSRSWQFEVRANQYLYIATRTTQVYVGRRPTTQQDKPINNYIFVNENENRIKNC